VFSVIHSIVLFSYVGVENTWKRYLKITYMVGANKGFYYLNIALNKIDFIALKKALILPAYTSNNTSSIKMRLFISLGILFCPPNFPFCFNHFSKVPVGILLTVGIINDKSAVRLAS